ncbi:hypothetical protein J6590_029827 [Homalodisca vitripennis]|nr:hypothetical protein J6590_029827 [Homalodisca vitripennis]
MRVRHQGLRSHSSFHGTVERDFEAPGNQVYINNSKTILVGMCRFPNGSDVRIKIRIFTDIPDRLQLNYVLMGNFNLDALNNTHSTTKRLVDMLRSFGLDFLVKSPTRVTSTQTTIDNIVSNIPKVTVSVVNTASFDHYYQEAIIIGKQIERESKITKTIRETRSNSM